jgi:hypothetical protein
MASVGRSGARSTSAITGESCSYSEPTTSRAPRPPAMQPRTGAPGALVQRRLEARGATRRRRRSGRGTSAAARLRTTGPSASPAQPHPRRLPGRQRSPRDNAPHGARAPGARPRYDHCRRERPDLLAHGLLSHVQLVRRVPAFASLRASPWRRVRRSPQTKPESAVPRECRHPHSLEGGRAPACLPRLLQRVPCGGPMDAGGNPRASRMAATVWAAAEWRFRRFCG